MWWYVYLIQHNVTKQVYIGLTKNLQKRLTDHNQGKTKATYRRDGKWVLIYAEAYRNKKDAKRREKRLKHYGSAKQELFKRIKKCFI